MNTSMPYPSQPDGGPAISAARTARNVVWNYTGYAYQIAINLGLTWYVVRKVTIVEYGIFLFVMSLSATLYLFDFGILSVLVQAFAEASAVAGKERFNRLLSTAFLALTALGMLGTLIFCGLAAFLPGPFKIPHIYLHEAFVIFIIAGLIVLLGFSDIAIQQAYHAFHRFDRTNQIQLGTATLQIVLSVFVLAIGHGVVALALVQLAVLFIRLVILIAALPASLPGTHLSLMKFDPKLLKPLFHLSKWAFLNNASSSLFDMLMWVVLGSFGSMEQAAIFGLASKLPRQLWNLIDKGGTVAFPQLSAFFARGDRRSFQRGYLKTQRMLSGGVLPFVVLGCFAARPLMAVWAGGRYLGAAAVLQILLLGVASHVTGYCSNQLLYAAGKIRRAATISASEYAIAVALAVALVPRYGAVGLAAAMVTGQILINCSWLTWAACKLSGTSGQTLLRAVFGGLAFPAAILCAAMAVIWGASRFLAPPWKLLAAAVIGCVYLGVWGGRNLLAAQRTESESAA